MAPPRPATGDTHIKRRANEIDVACGTPLDVELGRSLQGKRQLIERSQRLLSGLLGDDSDLVRAARVNLMLLGPDHVTRDVVDALSPRSRQPVIVAHPGEPLVLAPIDQVGTMILHDVGAFGLADQRRLLDWLDGAAGRTQVISTTSRPLLPLINAGAFFAALYYRLNSLYVDLSSLVRNVTPLTDRRVG